MLIMIDARVSPAKAAELKKKLEEIASDINDEGTEDPQGVSVNLMIGSFVQDPPAPSS